MNFRPCVTGRSLEYKLLPGFVTGIHKDSVRRWNLWFPTGGVFAEVLAGRATGTQITPKPYILTGIDCAQLSKLSVFHEAWFVTFSRCTVLHVNCKTYVRRV